MTRLRDRARPPIPSFINLDATYDATDNLTFDGQAGWTLGSGRTTYAPAYEWQGGNGASYTFNGYTNLATVSFPASPRTVRA